MPSRRVSNLAGRLGLLDRGTTELERLCLGSVDLLGVTGAALILMSGPEPGALIKGSSGGSAAIEELQFSLGEGPCFHAFESGRPVLEPDLSSTAAAARWPIFTRDALAGGARAIFAIPLWLGAIRLGVLYLYRDRTGMLTREQLADAFGIAHLATHLLLGIQAQTTAPELGPGLGDAWEDRAVVHQATGMVAIQLGAGLADALAHLRAHAYGNERSLYDVAIEVVERRLRFEH
jgi:GAF domain